ncbi:MAG: DegT/DnrJ/EryC1/StrS family aminotransferase [bacterium]
MIPVNEPLLAGRELEYVTRCIRSGWISSAGEYIEEFERQWAAYCGAQYGISVSNGTAALQVAVGCIDLKPGDEVIMPSFTIISCALAVTACGGKPVLVDSDPLTWTMDVSRIEERITPRTRAIMPVHIYGHPCDMDPIMELARRYRLAVIEDAAEAHGAEYKGKRAGSLGHLGCFSFYANKIITTGEGGMVLTNSKRYAERARSLRNLCFRKGRRFLHTELGNNFRLTNLQAAIGLAQIERINELIEKKRWMGRRYTHLLQGIPGVILPIEMPWARNVYWMYGIMLDREADMDAAECARRLYGCGVDTRPFFLGMHAQPVFHRMGLFKGERYPVAEALAARGLYLPSGLTITEDQIGAVCDAVRTVCTGVRTRSDRSYRTRAAVTAQGGINV